ncbi:MAG: NAD+ synthase [Phycisphaerae bacterium]|nr:MAG: NAD+ synthase [Phycisphaerae bacterium]
MRLALCPLNPTIGDIPGNAALADAAIAAAREAGADLVVLPELCISGYPPKDLLLVEGFVASCEAAAQALGASSTAATAGTKSITAIFGSPRAIDPAHPAHGTANSLYAYRDGRLLAIHDKRLLPTYDVFDEDRYFTPGLRPVVIDVQTASGATRVGLAICEDLWKGEDAGFSTRYLNAPDPVTEVVAAGATLLVSPSASPFVLGKGHRHQSILARHARAHRIHVASVNQLGGNDDLIFDGHTLLYAPSGDLLAPGATFTTNPLITTLTPSPSRPSTLSPPPDELQLFHALTLGIRDYLRKTGHRHALIGLSGGIDSALTAVLAVAALGAANVQGLAMPGPYSSDHALTDAQTLARNLGIDLLTIPITPPMDAFRSTIDPAFLSRSLSPLGASLPDLTEENLQSRLRGTTLMALSNRTGALVLTTGNKSELSVGYCTLYGDMNGGLAVLSDLSKHWVYALSRWINANPAACGFSGPPIPEGSITKPPSAELRPNQTDQDSLPPYDTLDEIIRRYVEHRESPARIARETGLDAALVARVARMINTSEFKRRQLAVGLKVTTVAYGTGRRMPIAQNYRPT